MKHLTKLFGLLPIAALMAGCSSDTMNEPEQTDSQESYKLMLAVMPENNNGGSSTTSGTDPECAFNADNLYFATYKDAGTTNASILHKLKDRTGLLQDENIKAAYFVANWGPTISGHFPTATYANGFYAAAFSVPANVSSTFSLQPLTDATGAYANYIINWPGATNTTWAPADDETNNIPMAGINLISKSFLDGYRYPIHDEGNAMLCPSIPMIRSMAKIIINDPEEFISKATFKTPNKGILIPHVASWMDESVAAVPVAPKNGVEDINQVQEGWNGPNGAKQYVFYTYERSFLDGNSVKGAADAARSLITLVSDELGQTATVQIAPYTNDGKPDTDADLKTKDGGVWQGIMRNHVYEFTVSKPQNMEIEITVHVKNWEYKKINTDL